VKNFLAVVLGIGMSISCGAGSTTMSGPMISVSITPSTALVAFGAAQQFTATVTGTSNKAVTWSVVGEGCIVDTCGMVDANGLYTAPEAAGGHASIRVIAVLIADSTKLGTASVSLGS
jgi:Bacterial Ig-like domain (group 2)